MLDHVVHTTGHRFSTPLSGNTEGQTPQPKLLPAPSLSQPGTAWGVGLQPPEFLASLQSSSDSCWLPKSGLCLLGNGSGWPQRSFKQLGGADKA